MKKILFLSTVFLFALLAFTNTNAQSFNGKIADSTFTNATTASYGLTVTGVKHAVTFVYTVTKNTGTVAGTITLQGTLDGINYVTLKVDTLTDANAVIGNSYDYNGYSKYKVTIAQSGTSVTNYKVQALYR
jgi:hypothetical protein